MIAPAQHNTHTNVAVHLDGEHTTPPPIVETLLMVASGISSVCFRTRGAYAPLTPTQRTCASTGTNTSTLIQRDLHGLARRGSANHSGTSTLQQARGQSQTMCTVGTHHAVIDGEKPGLKADDPVAEDLGWLVQRDIGWITNVD